VQRQVRGLVTFKRETLVRFTRAGMCKHD
jgi:hypothetical protein